MNILKTETYQKWFDKLKDQTAKSQIRARLFRLAIDGNFGDVKPVGNNISEMRIHCGPGYRIYYTVRGFDVVILLMGTAKPTKHQQQEDIKRAKQIAKEV